MFLNILFTPTKQFFFKHKIMYRFWVCKSSLTWKINIFNIYFFIYFLNLWFCPIEYSIMSKKYTAINFSFFLNKVEYSQIDFNMLYTKIFIYFYTCSIWGITSVYYSILRVILYFFYHNCRYANI